MSYWKYIRRSSFFVLFLLSNNLQANDNEIDTKLLSKKIDEIQKNIDLFDGSRDEKVSLENVENSELAEHTYFTLIDEIQKSIRQNGFKEIVKYNDLVGIHNALMLVNERNYHHVKHFSKVFENAHGILKSKSSGFLEDYLEKNRFISLKNIILYKNEPSALNFLRETASIYPAELLRQIKQIYEEPYTKRLIVHTAKVAPNSAKQYFGSKNFINNFLLSSDDIAIKTVLNIYREFGSQSKAYLFLDEIVKRPDLYTMTQYHILENNPKEYFTKLIALKRKENPLGVHSINQELKSKSLDYVRPINDQHLLKDASERFASVDSLSPDQLYTILVYTPEEIFTSTFNGIFERLINKINEESINGYHFLQRVGMNKFRTFIKLCSGYNALKTFISTMDFNAAKNLFKAFVSGLQHQSKFEEAVNVADTFGSIEDSSYLNLFGEYLAIEYVNARESGDINGAVLYGLLISLIADKSNVLQNPKINLEDLYQIPDISKFPFEYLMDGNGKHVQQHFFYDDDDGIYSYNSFLKAFRSSFWKVEENEHYVKISSLKGKDVEIYANKPLSEREGQAILKKFFKENSIRPYTIVHRGHSYYAGLTINHINKDAKIVFLGSCGSYHNLTSVIDRSDRVHIISSKQIGTSVVNNSILRSMADMIRNGDDIDWRKLWDKLDKEFKGNPKSYDQFKDYIPPHKNLGAIFIQAYTRLSKYGKG